MNQRTEPLSKQLERLLERAIALHRKGKIDEAEPLYRNYLVLNPNHAQVWTNLGALLRNRGCYEPSIAAHRKALQLEPEMIGARNNLANVLADSGAFEESERLRRSLFEADPGNPIRLRDLCACLRGLGRHEEVIELVEKTAQTARDVDECILQRSLSHLMLGNYEQGFADFEHRYAGDEVKLPDNAPWARWKGEDLKGKKIIVLPEQGFGDAILMSRFLPGLKQKGGTVHMVVKPPLRRLFARLKGLDKMIDVAKTSMKTDYYIPNMSLPHLVGLPGGKPPPLPRLAIPDDSRKRAKALTAGHGNAFKIGVIWTGSSTYRANSRRSTEPESFLGLSIVPGVQLFSLYKGDRHSDFLKSGMAGLIVDAGGADRDFADTAAVIEKMDLLITTDTAVVHVGASLGKPVWNLLSREGFWLYGRGETTPWYPSMRLFQQHKQGDWPELFARVEAALRAHLKELGEMTSPIRIETAPGEVIDKITILEIKAERIADPDKLANIRRELAALTAALNAAVTPDSETDRLRADLKAVNEALWQIEDDIRDCERSGDFGARFVDLARAVYQTNDRRADLKRRINGHLGSSLVEEKSYRPY